MKQSSIIKPNKLAAISSSLQWQQLRQKSDLYEPDYLIVSLFAYFIHT